jgi:acyl-[acyl-carrier-protein] desaturase
MTAPPEREPLPTTDELEPPLTATARQVKPYDARQLLIDLEPTAARLLDRHLTMAEDWLPHEYIPYSQGRDFDKEPWTPDQPRLSGVARTAFEVNLLTEDNLPSYHRLIYGMFGAGDGAWVNWIGRWTAEEGRHSIVLRDYLTVTRNLDPAALEHSRMAQVEQGYERPTLDPLRGLAYVALQEVATRAAHRNTGRYSDDPVADRIMARISADENLHATFYRDVLAAAAEAQPSATVEAVVAEILAFEMPGAGIVGFRRKAAEMALAGIYDLRIHRDEVVLPLVRKLRLFELTGLSPEAEGARSELGRFLEDMDASARKLEERRARKATR